jgi:ATP-binding cassette subfamily B (MDR/TAP) protein 1
MINQSELSTKFSADSFAFQGAIGEKVSLMLQTFAMFVAGFIIAFVKGWKMTLVTLCAIPAIAIFGGIYVTAVQTKDKRNSEYYAKAGGMA